MRLVLAVDAALQSMRMNRSALRYMATQLAAKAMAAVAQLYAIYVFSKIHAPNEAALIFILLGYGIWIQVFEFGISQVIQNGLNTKVLKISGACRIIVLHYAIMIIIAMAAILFSEVLKPLQGGQRNFEANVDALVFPLGIALMLVATNNTLVQRMLLVVNRGMVASKLILLQSIFSVIVLLIFQWRGADFIESVVIYLSIPIITYAPLVLRFAGKVWRTRKRRSVNWQWTMKNALGFWGLTALSSVYMGADYFFAAKHLTDMEMIAYHFSSRVFFISYIAYFSYVQYRARSITAATHDEHPKQIWEIVKGAAFIGTLSVALVLVASVIIVWSGRFDKIVAPGLVVMPLILSAALYYCIRVFRDVGLVLIWNLGFQRFLYPLHILEVAFSFLLLNILATELGGKGIFFAMALVAALSTAIIYIALCRMSPNFKQIGG